MPSAELKPVDGPDDSVPQDARDLNCQWIEHRPVYGRRLHGYLAQAEVGPKRCQSRREGASL